MRNKPVILIIIIVMAITGAGYGFFKYKKMRSAHNQITLYGNVDIRDVLLGFRIAGRIAVMHHNEGDRVHKGGLLATLEKEPYEKELALRAAELAEAKALLINTGKNYERYRKLVKMATISQSDHDSALAERNMAQAKLDAANANLELAQIHLRDAEIYAPNDGVILTRILEPGSIVAAGSSVYTLALDRPIWIRTFIDEPDLGKIHPGQKVVVRTDSGKTYIGQIGFISPQAEFTPKNVETVELRTSLVYRLRIIINNPDDGLRQGMPVTCKL